MAPLQELPVMKISLITTNVTSGTANTIAITPSWTATAFSEGYAVWIDYNKTDYLQMPVKAVKASFNNPVTGTITIPASAALGTTRMRFQ
jgi:hypothetical protein